MIGFKAFDKDLKCRNFQYEIGRTYRFDGEPIPCKQGFHFCNSIAETYNYYLKSDSTRICKVEAIGDIRTDDGKKYCTNKIVIVEEIKEDWLRKGNADRSSSGYCNTGDRNTGNCNTGGQNTGDWNTGYCNIGYWNTGDYNAGDCNTGNCNTGDRNTGDWNTTNSSSGCFNTVEQFIYMFNKPTKWTFDNWRYSRAYKILNKIPREAVEWICKEDMTDKEKEKNPTYNTTGGYLKVLDEKIVAQKYWNELSEEDKRQIYNLPNYDKEIFKRCTGIEV